VRLDKKFLKIIPPLLIILTVFTLSCGESDYESAVTVETPSAEISDRDITAAVKSELLISEAVPSHRITVSTTDGVVTLTGTVSNILASERAVDVTEVVRDVRSIINMITVEPVERPDDEIERDIEKSLLLDPVTESYELETEVENGVVRLEGIVDSWQEKQFAAYIAKGVSGVREIRNEITFVPDIERSDIEIQAEIQRQLRIDSYISDGLIDIDVEDGSVTLSGAVGSLAEKTRAYRKAWVSGVSSVDTDNLEVKYWLRDDMRKTASMLPKSDDEIRAAVEDAFLYDPRVKSFDIEIDVVDDGTVTLTGKVDNLTAKRAAEENARNTVGVTDVIDHLKVRPVVAAKDMQIEQNIEQALLRNPVVNRFDITVDVRNRKVYLHGQVDTSYEAQQAEKAAADVFGVAAVENHLQVGSTWSPKTDTAIREDVQDELFWSPFVEKDDIAVTVQDGVVTLEGTVESENEMDAAIDNAFDGGAVSVINRLSITETDDRYPEEFMYPPYNFPVY